MALKLGELVAYLRADDRQLREGLDRARERLRHFGVAAGAAAGVALAAGIAGAMDLDRARAQLAAQVGDPAMAERLGRIAGEVYGRGFGESAAESMEAVRAVMQSGLLSPDADAAVIEEITVAAQALATTFGQDVTQTARAAGQMIKTGLAGDAQEALDILTRGFQLTGDQADDLLDTFSEYSTKFRDLGLSGAQAMGLLSQGLQAGARDADFVADALKEFAIRAIDGSKTTAEGFRALGLDARKMAADIAAGGPQAAAALDLTLDRLRAIEDPVARDAAAVALFGTKAEDLGDALYALDPSSAVDALGQVEGAAGSMADTLEQSASQRLEAFRRKAQEALVEKLAEALPTLERVGSWMSENEGTVTAVATALGVLAIVIGTILGIYKTWIILQTALNVVMMLNPIGLIVLAIVGLIAIIVGLWLRFEGFRNFWKATWDFILNVFTTWWELFKGFWTAIGEFFVGLFKGWWNLFTGFWGSVFDGVSKGWKWVVDKVSGFVDFVRSLPGKIRRAARGMWDGIVDAARGALNTLIRLWNRLDFSIDLRVPNWIPGVGGRRFYVGDIVPDLPMLARGGHILAPGLAIVGEAGPELVHLGRGATVQPLTSNGVGAGAVNGTLRITGELRARGSDLVVVLRDQVAIRGGNVQAVVGTSY